MPKPIDPNKRYFYWSGEDDKLDGKPVTDLEIDDDGPYTTFDFKVDGVHHIGLKSWVFWEDTPEGRVAFSGYQQLIWRANSLRRQASMIVDRFTLK